jgi:RecA/RadA recombinase
LNNAPEEERSLIPQDRGSVYTTEFAPTLQAFHECDDFVRYVQGPFGSGKSSACVQEVARRAAHQEPDGNGIRKSRCAVIRNTYRQLEDTTIKTFLDWFPDRVWGNFVVGDMAYNMRFALPDSTIVECEVLFRALDRPDQVGNLLSLELTYAWMNEMREVPYEIFDALQGRVGRYPSMRHGGPTWDGIWGDSNPPDDQHWIYRIFEEDKPEGYSSFYQPSGLSKEAENLPHLKKDYYKRLKVGKSEDYVRVYIHGMYGYLKDGKPVYPEYQDNVHCKEFDYNPLLPLYRGWDFGRTPSMVLTQITSAGQWRIFDELVADNMGIQRFLKEADLFMQKNYPDAVIYGDYCDPAGQNKTETSERAAFDYMLMHGLTPIGGDQNPEVRIESVREPLNEMRDGQPALLLHPRCKVLRKGFNGGYCYRAMKVGTERYTEKPDKNQYSHPHDALQYIATRIYGRFASKDDDVVHVVGGINNGRHTR